MGSVDWGCARNLWSEQPLSPPVEDVITGSEFLVDLPMWSLLGQQDEKKRSYMSIPDQTQKILWCPKIGSEKIASCWQGWGWGGWAQESAWDRGQMPPGGQGHSPGHGHGILSVPIHLLGGLHEPVWIPGHSVNQENKHYLGAKMLYYIFFPFSLWTFQPGDTPQTADRRKGHAKETNIGEGSFWSLSTNLSKVDFFQSAFCEFFPGWKCNGKKKLKNNSNSPKRKYSYAPISYRAKELNWGKLGFFFQYLSVLHCSI